MSRRGLLVVIGLLVLSLGGNGVLGYYLYETREDLDSTAAVAEDASSDADALELKVGDQERELAALRAQPQFDPAPLERRLSDLRYDLNFLEGSNNRLWNVVEEVAGIAGSTGSASVDARDIQKPFQCSYGDIAVWDFQGLTC